MAGLKAKPVCRSLLTSRMTAETAPAKSGAAASLSKSPAASLARSAYSTFLAVSAKM